MRDLSNWAFPQRHRLIELWKSSGAPLRDPFFHGGQPFLGNPNNAALYPTGILGFWFDQVRSTNLEIVFHVALCAAGAYGLARVMKLGRTASFVSGAAFAFCGVTLSLGSLFNRVLAMPHLAFLVLFWHLYVRTGRRRWFAAASIAGALMVLAGSVETLILAWVLAFFWTLFADFPAESLPWRKRLAGIAALGAVTVLLAAVQILPAQRLAARSSRTAMRYSSAADWSLNPRRLPEVAYAAFLGRADTLRENDYWGSRLEDKGYPYLLSIYLGVPVLLLAGAAVGGGIASRLSRRFRLFLATAALLSVLLALGRYSFLFPLLYRFVFPIRLFRYPIKFLFGGTLPIALLAGCGADLLLGSDRESRKRILTVFVVGTALFAAVALLFESQELRRRILTSVLLRPTLPAIEDGVARSVLRSTALAVAMTLIAILRRWPARWHAWALALLVAVDLMSAGSHVNPTAPKEWMAATPILARQIRAPLADGRFYSELLPEQVTIRADTNEAFWLADWQRQVLGETTGPTFDVPIIFHNDFDGLAPVRLAIADNFVARLPWPRRLPLLSAAAVRVFVAATPVSVAGVEQMGEIPNRSNFRFFAHRNLRAAARETLVTEWITATSASQAAAAVSDPGFDPRVKAVLESRTPIPPEVPCGPGAIRPLARTPKTIILEGMIPCSAFVVFSEPWDEGWHADVDGRPETIVNANLLFFAVAVPPGRHRIEIRYRPASVAWGAAVSALTAGALGLFVWRDRDRRHLESRLT